MPTNATLTVAETLPKSFLLSCRTRGDKPAMREKLYGIWNAISWNQWLDRSRAIAFALHQLGFRPGDVASVLANTVPEWNYADFGILCAGGVSSGIYPTDSAKQVEYLINDSRTSVLFVEDDEQLDKALEVRERCPTLRKIVVFDMEGLRTFSDPMVVSLDEFMAAGRNYGQGKDALFEELVASRKPDDLAILVYTSGTTGPPKGAMHSHRNVVYTMQNCMHPELSLSWHEGDERWPSCRCATSRSGSPEATTRWRPGSAATLPKARRRCPTISARCSRPLFGAVPRVWEKFYAGITIALKDATPLQQWAYRHAISAGNAIADARLARREPTALEKLRFQAAYWLVLKNIRRMIGLDRCRWLFTGAAPISPELIRWYLALGLDMYEVYGQTENCGLATAMPANGIKLGTVGKSVPYGQVTISPPARS